MKSPVDNKRWINFEDVRQFFYCKRKIYFKYCVNAKTRTSYKMKKGSEYHEKKFKEKREKENKNIWVKNEKLKIKGFIDYVVKEKNKIIALGDYKQKYPYNGKIPEQYKMQLVVEAITVDEEIEYVEMKIPKGRKIIEKITKEEKEKVKKAIEEIRKIIEKEIIPEQTMIINKCKECECKNICVPL